MPSFRRTLAAGVVDGVVRAVFAGEDQLADGKDVIALLDQILQNSRQGFRGVEGGVVEEDDGPRPHPGGHPVGDGGGVVVLPVQTIPVGSGCKVLGKTNRGDFMGTIVYIIYTIPRRV